MIYDHSPQFQAQQDALLRQYRCNPRKDDMNDYTKAGDSKVNPDGSVSTLVDNGDGTLGTLTTGCPDIGPVYLHKSTGVVSAHPEFVPFAQYQAVVAERDTLQRDLEAVGAGGVQALSQQKPTGTSVEQADAAIKNAAPQQDKGCWVSDEEVEQLARLVRDLDVALNGLGAAKQASLCDVVSQVTLAAQKLGRPVLAPQQDAQEPAKAALAALRHSANEWADMAANGLSWLRNIADGISDVKTALEIMETNMKHCREVCAESARAYDASLQHEVPHTRIGPLFDADAFYGQQLSVYSGRSERQAAPQPAPSIGADVAAPEANWPQLRSALATLILGFGSRGQQTMEACYSVLDAVTEPGMPLALLRLAAQKGGKE